MRAALVLTLVFLSGCAALGGATDGTSLARGFANDGVLIGGVQLPRAGDGYYIPNLWQSRGNTYGTDELVGVIVRSARRVELEYPGSRLYVADLSPERGGIAARFWHRSHQNGRDADLIFYAFDENGAPAPAPSTMYRFGADGVTLGGRGWKLDVERQWALVRALLEDPIVDVQYLFISSPLRQMLLDHATAIGEPKALIERASYVLTQPADSLPHDDHLHLRIYCPLNDRALGCRDRGPLRWFKKTYKYLSERKLLGELPASLGAQVARPFCAIVGQSLSAML